LTRQNTGAPDDLLAGMPALAVPLQAVIEIAGSDPEHEAAPDALPANADRLNTRMSPAADALPVADPDGAVKPIAASSPSATVPAPEKAVPVGAESDTAGASPLVLHDPVASPDGAEMDRAWIPALAADAPVAEPSGVVSDSAWRLPAADALPDAVPVAGDNDRAWMSPEAAAAPVAAPVGAESDNGAILPSAETPPPPAVALVCTHPLIDTRDDADASSPCIQPPSVTREKEATADYQRISGSR
jgi:hypothetical protein